MNRYNIVSFFGVFIILFFAWLLSNNRKKINYNIIFWGLLIQVVFIVFVFLFPIGTKFFLLLNDLVINILESATSGTKFVFGRLALAPGEVNSAGETSLGFFLAFQVLPTIVFFSAFMSILYFYNIVPFIINNIAKFFSKKMKISAAESLCATSNIFVGIESFFTVRPYLKKMTKSELCTILSACMATASGNVMGIYVFSLKSTFPNIAAHLISASFISVPAAIILSKIILPEEDEPFTMGKDVSVSFSKESTIFEAIIDGANSGVKLIAGITALLLAILGLVELCNLLTVFLGSKINALFHINIDFSIKGMLGYIFYPFTLILGVPLNDVGKVSKIIGERVIVTEVTAYFDLAKEISLNTISNRSAIITSYVLCGFAHIASLAIFVGGLAALIPKRVGVISEISFRAFLVSTLATLMTGCIAGIFLTESSILF